MKKKIIILTTILSIVFLIIGSTLAYWTWSSNNLVTVNITTSMGGIGLTLNGGTTTINNLAPSSCTHSTYANKLPVTIERYNETEYLATTILTLKLTSFTWEHSKPSVSDLSNIKFAVTNSNSSCINPISSGDPASATMNNNASTAEVQDTAVFNWEYVLPANNGTQSNPIQETYYLYVWIDPDYTFNNFGSNQIQDPLQDLSLTVTWSASSIEQTDTLKPKLYDYIQTNADTTNSIDFSNTSEDDNTLGIYRLSSTASDTYPVYFYRGDVTDNNVFFADKCWQIVRTTSTGGVKLIYNGLNTGTSESPACNSTGTDSQIGTSIFSSDYTVGYMHGTLYPASSEDGTGWKYAPDVTYSNGVYTLTSKEIDGVTYNVEVKNDISGTNLNYHQYTCGNSTDNSCSSVRFVHGVYASTAVYYVTLSNGISVNDILDVTLTNSSNTTSSTIKIAVDTWYSTEMIGYTNKLEDTMYCNDRSIYSLGGWNPDGGSISSPLYFGIRERRSITFQPTLTCNKNDAFTVTESSAGNGKLTYPVGLITADEFIMAGGAGNMLKQSNIYLQHGTYWTMTPLRYSKEGIGEILHIDASLANSISGNHSNGIRPMISLKNSIRISSGEGTVANPFIIE